MNLGLPAESEGESRGTAIWMVDHKNLIAFRDCVLFWTVATTSETSQPYIKLVLDFDVRLTSVGAWEFSI